MTSLDYLKNQGAIIEKLLAMKSPPIAVKLIQNENEIPEHALRPMRDRGVHMAQCQAFALSRREGLTVAMLREDNWCWAPMVCFGLAKPPEFTESDKKAHADAIPMAEVVMDKALKIPNLEYGKYMGLVSAPLTQVSFEPDIVLIYCNPAQIRALLFATVGLDRPTIKSEFDPFDSCIYAIIPPMQDNQYRITIPDPGEYQRALVSEDKVIFSVPNSRLTELVDGLEQMEKLNNSYRQHAMQMCGDFPQPPFYQLLFDKWGIKQGG